MSGGGSPSGYVIERSLRFMAASSTILSRVPSVAGNRRTWTYSTVVKRGALGTVRPILSGYSDLTNKDNNSATFFFDTDDTLYLSILGAVGANMIVVRTLARFRDPSAQYHVVLAMDTTQATNTNGVRIYVNGVLQTLTFTAYTQNHESNINNTTVQYIGAHTVNTLFGGGTAYFDGYLSETRFINGLSLDASNFGETNHTTGQWVAKKYTGTYGTNGFYLDFKDGTSTTTLGQDKSGNGNNWTLTNFTRSAGVNDCWMLDVPAGNGSDSSGNYCVLTPLIHFGSGVSASLTQANLSLVSSSGNGARAFGSFKYPSGKWYFEVERPAGAQNMGAGIVKAPYTLLELIGIDSNSWGYYTSATNYGKWTNGVRTVVGSAFTNTSDVLGVAFDSDAGELFFYKNGTLLDSGASFTGLTSGEYYPAISANQNTSSVNFGQRSFAYTPPTGFKALCTSNLTSTDVIESGSFTGNANANGPFIWCNGTPETLTINGNAVTWGTHADKLSNGFKLRTSSSSYNSSGTNTWTAAILSPESKSAFKHQNAKGN